MLAPPAAQCTALTPELAFPHHGCTAGTGSQLCNLTTHAAQAEPAATAATATAVAVLL
jgi:hypothetical protein